MVSRDGEFWGRGSAQLAAYVCGPKTEINEKTSNKTLS